MKKWLAQQKFNHAVRVRDKVNFMKKLSELVAEGYQFSEAVILLLPHHVQDVQLATTQVMEQLREGHGVVTIMAIFQVPAHHLITLTIAEENGEMIAAFARIAERMAIEEHLKRKFQQALLYPVTLLTLLFLMFLVFRTAFFPRITAITAQRQSNTSSPVYEYLLYLPDFFLFLFLTIIIAITVAKIYIRKQPIARQLSLQRKIFVWRTVQQTHLTKQFAHHLGSLLHAGIALQDSLQILSQQKYHPYIQHIATTIHAHVLQGTPLITILQLNDELLPQLVKFVTHGEQSGFLSKELLIYSELLEEKTTKGMERIIFAMQPLLFVIIALCIVAAYISLLVPIYNMMKF
ncbi:competence type IV pilus assembly protein ComGB [Metalysinibacillus jejuensis]|nr:competence type IV pilus assembly protein ComGB [Metalysinibacillus jejuensis]